MFRVPTPFLWVGLGTGYSIVVIVLSMGSGWDLWVWVGCGLSSCGLSRVCVQLSNSCRALVSTPHFNKLGHYTINIKPISIDTIRTDKHSNIDENRLLYKLLQNKLLVFKNDTCHDGKRSKEGVVCSISSWHGWS